MARHFPSSPNPNLPLSSTSFSSFFVFIAVFSIFSLVNFLCTSHKTKNPNQAHKIKFVSKMNSRIGNKALSMVKMISWRKVEAAEDEDEEDDGDRDVTDEEEVWRKTIIKGERCRPLDFSGKIDYDSEGNLLSDSRRATENSETVA